VRSTVFFEFLGIGPDAIASVEQAAFEWLDRSSNSENCRAGLSPHAPYSTHEVLYVSAIAEAAARALPLATHLAETTDELEFLDKGSGSFLSFLKELGVWRPERWTMQLADYLAELAVPGTPFLIAHGNYLPPDLPIAPHGTVVYCPRTHAAFGHAPFPLRQFLDCGVRVALGTDSLASNPDLDLLAEMRFVHGRFTDLPGDQLLRMGTLSGAEALGWSADTGSITAGKSADLAVVQLQGGDEEPHRLLFEAAAAVSRTMFRGAWR
jgi:aminodeoxyfutalosine deaminase